MPKQKRTIRDYPSLLREQAHCGFEAKPSEAGSDATGDQEDAGNAGSGNDIAGGEEEVREQEYKINPHAEALSVHATQNGFVVMLKAPNGMPFSGMWVFEDVNRMFEFLFNYFDAGAANFSVEGK